MRRGARLGAPPYLGDTMTTRTTRGSGVDVRDEGVRSGAVADDVGVREARDRFGGLDVPGTLVGMLAALALLVLLAGLIGAAIGTIGYQTGLRTPSTTSRSARWS